MSTDWLVLTRPTSLMAGSAVRPDTVRTAACSNDRLLGLAMSLSCFA